uniref:TOX high mobility group box family member 4 n=1 Tax=Sus scrofa TaxID=9823 RepID=A0A4X1U9D7_PIG
MEFPGGNDNYLTITGPSHPFLSGAEDLDHSIGAQYSANPPVAIDVPVTDMTSGLMGHSQLTTTDQSELSSQLGLRARLWSRAS